MAGRPRSARAHRSVLDAAVALFAEHGIDGTSMDAIARRSAVSKATIYKHWPNKDALALETLDHLHRLDDWPDTQSADVMADIRALLSRRPSPRSATLRAKIMPHLMGTRRATRGSTRRGVHGSSSRRGIGSRDC
jgi:AcrR family transcriptional regulator